MKPKPAVPPRGQEQKYRYRSKVLDVLAASIRVLIIWGSLSFIVHRVFTSLETFAGQQTMANIGISFLGDFKVSEGLAYIFGVSGITYGLRQRKLRRSNIERLAERPRTLEKQIDAKRTSSGLTVRGTTRPEDSNDA